MPFLNWYHIGFWNELNLHLTEKYTVNKLLFRTTLFQDLPEMNWFWVTYYCVQLVLTTTLFITYIWQILVQSKKFCDNEALANLFKISCKWIKVLKNGLQCLFIENIHFPSEKLCNYRSISNSTKNFYSILVDTANHLSQSIKINKSLFFFICDFMKILLTNLL